MSKFADFLRPHPGAAPLDAATDQALRAALAALPADFAPRTRHYNGAEHAAQGEHPDPNAPAGSAPNYANRLLLENSPYLRQHAFNPVNWRPWGPAAFAEARAANLPIFLSIGYATCHWCHVMEHESFEDLGIAALLNSRYVPIKVDREERPDVDAVYMAAVQALTGHGGWPMSVWLAADPSETTGVRGLPFFAGTYFPAHDGDRGARVGFATILKHFADAYATQHVEAIRDGRRLADHVAQELAADSAGDLPTTADVDRAAAVTRQFFDPVNGGRRGAPKFPSNIPAGLLLRHHLRTGDAQSRHMALFTLQRMAMGGMYDHVGGGFHRYSTDERWFAPHFEKMLYDQGLIGMALADAVAATGDPLLGKALTETADYLLREMQHPLGGFYSATDADSQGREGLYFLWTADELTQTLGAADAALVARLYNASAGGTFEGSNILHLRQNWPELAAQEHADAAQLASQLRGLLDKLLAARQKRVAPLCDHKIVPAWNGLAISALGRAGWQLQQPRWVTAAQRAADFVWEHLRADGRLKRSWVAGNAKGHAQLDDLAFMVQALLDLAEATGAAEPLARAMQLQAEQDAHFADARHGGYFATPDDAETLLARAKPDRDGAEPSGNSVAALNLLRLAAITGADSYRRKADAALQAMANRVRDQPFALTELLAAVEARHWPLREVVLVRPAGSSAQAFEPFLAQMRRHWMPHRVLLQAEEGAPLAALAALAPPVAGKTALHGQATAYVCTHGHCELPTADPQVFASQLAARPPAP